MLYVFRIAFSASPLHIASCHILLSLLRCPVGALEAQQAAKGKVDEERREEEKRKEQERGETESLRSIDIKEELRRMTEDMLKVTGLLGTMEVESKKSYRKVEPRDSYMKVGHIVPEVAGGGHPDSGSLTIGIASKHCWRVQ